MKQPNHPSAIASASNFGVSPASLNTPTPVVPLTGAGSHSQSSFDSTPSPEENGNYLFHENEDWTFPLLDRTYKAIEDIAINELKLNVYPNQIEIIDSEQMLESYTSVGMPNYYRHWSFGKAYESQAKEYKEGYANLAYEIVLNSSPTIAYLQENNTMTMQALVIAHACFGHNAVFKNNEYFRTWTNASSIMDYLSFARNYIAKCETVYGEEEVESLIDSCHALQYHGVNTYKKKNTSRRNSNAPEQEEEEVLDVNFARLLDKAVIVPKPEDHMTKPRSNKDNLLYFIEKNSPALPEWKREIIRIVRTIAQYFYPQMITKVVNEGYASYTHYRLMQRLHEKNLITDGSWLEFVLSHTNVVAQSGVAYGQFRGWNPYALGFAIFQDIERMCKNPTEEDRYYFPHLVGRDSIEATTEAMSGYNDSGFISQYLSPKVMRDFKMFSLYDASKTADNYMVNAVSDEAGYTDIRQALSTQHERNYSIPNIEVVGANLHTDRSLVLQYTPYRERKISEKTKSDMVAHLENLWGFKVVLRDAT